MAAALLHDLIYIRGFRLLVGRCHLSSTYRACFAVVQEGRAAAEDDDAEGDDETGVAKEEKVKVEEVSVMALAEGLRQQATADCKERGSESEFKPTTSTVLSTGRPRT